MTTVLLTGVGGPTPRGIARSLKRYGGSGPYRIIGTDSNPRAVGLYDDALTDRGLIVPPATDPGYWHEIERIVAEEAVDVAVIQPEAEVEAWAERCETQGAPCRVLLPPARLVRVLRDKGRFADLLADTGLVPDTISGDARELEFEHLGERLGWPFWVRSRLGTSGLGAFKINNPESLRHWLALQDDIANVMASVFLPGRNLACKLLYHNNELVRASCAERVSYLMAKVSPTGITGNTSFGRLINRRDIIEIGTLALRTVSDRLAEPLQGLVTVDLKEDASGKPKITEVNARAVAFVSAFAAAGANIAEDLVQLSLGRKLQPAGYHCYQFEQPMAFLRDVDAHPIVLPEAALTSGRSST